MTDQRTGFFTPPDQGSGGTMVYTVDIGNGQVAEIEGPKGATPEQLQSAYAQSQGGDVAAPTEGGFADQLPDQPHTKLSPEDYTAYSQLLHTADGATLRHFLSTRGMSSEGLDAFVAARDKAKANGGQVSYEPAYALPKVASNGALDAAAGGVADTLTMGTFPKIGAALTAAGSAITGQGDFGDTYNRTLDQNEAIQNSDEAEHPYARIAGQLLGGLALPSGMEGLGLRVGSDVLRGGGTMADARAAVKIAVRNRMTTVGGAYGAAHGVGSADSIPDAITGGLTEGAMGAAGGAVLGQLAREGKPVAAAASPGAELMAAAGRQGIEPLPADVGGPLVRRLTSAAAQAPISASPVINAGQRVVQQTQAARDRIAATVGQALDPEAAGQSALGGAQKYLASSRAEVGGLYTQAEKAAGTTRIVPSKALDVLDQNIAELSETPGGSVGLNELQGLKDALSQGDFTVSGLRNMRTQLRDQFMKDGLRGSDVERRVGQVLDASRDDIANGLRNSGKGAAADLYVKADTAYAARVRTIDNVLKPIIGTREAPRSGEQIIKTLTSDLQGNNARAARFLRTLPAEEQNNTRASIISGLGKAGAGAQGADGDSFSMAAFLTHWNKIGETAKRAYFGDEAKSALNDLAKVAEGTKAAQSYANRSNSSGGIWGNLGLLAGSAAASPVAAGAGLVTQLVGGHLLASPRFARWLARAPRTALTPPAYVDRLSRIARAEPAIANEVLQLQQRLTDAFTSTPARMAAQEPSNETQGAQRQSSQQQPPEQYLQP